MTSQEEFILNPILQGLCSYESAKNGALDLLDFAKMNEAIDVDNENKRRHNEKK